MTASLSCFQSESELLQSVSAANGRSASSSKFYIEHRQGVTFAQENPDSKLPVFTSLADWEQVKSTKIDTCARILRYLLIRDDLPPIEFVNGEVVFPSLPPLKGDEQAKQATKIIVYQEWPSYRPLVSNVCSIHF